MSENIYYNRIEFVWKSLGYKSATMFARELGFNRGENILRLERQSTYQPSIDLLGDILKRFNNVNALWLITGEGSPFNNLTQKEYTNEEKRNEVAEPCSNCKILKEKIEKLSEDLIQSQKETILALKGEHKKNASNRAS